MTHDKVRQDFEAWCLMDNPNASVERLNKNSYECGWTAAQWEGYQARDAEIREKLESEGVEKDAAKAIYAADDDTIPHNSESPYRHLAKAAITKILEVI